jgi:uncharacterized protein (DUF1778 family)
LGDITEFPEGTNSPMRHAGHPAEQTLLDQRLFMVSGSQYQALMDLLEQSEKVNEGLRDLFSREASWDPA